MTSDPVTEITLMINNGKAHITMTGEMSAEKASHRRLLKFKRIGEEGASESWLKRSCHIFALKRGFVC